MKKSILIALSLFLLGQGGANAATADQGGTAVLVNPAPGSSMTSPPGKKCDHSNNCTTLGMSSPDCKGKKGPDCVKGLKGVCNWCLNPCKKTEPKCDQKYTCAADNYCHLNRRHEEE